MTSEYVLYRRRWAVLASFVVLSCSSAWMWITWSPIQDLVADHWGVSASAVDDLSGIYFYIYVMGSFVSMYLVVNHLGLRGGLVLGGIFNVLGAWIRCRGDGDYTHVYIGTLLCAVAQTFTLSTPPLISARWFGDEERATATAIGILANQLGTAFGLGSTIVFDFADDGYLNESVLASYLGLQLAVAVVALVLVFGLVEDLPPTPPSKAAYLSRYPHDTAASEETPLVGTDVKHDPTRALDYLSSVRLVLSSHRVYTLIFALSIGVFYTIPTFLSQLLPANWTARGAGWLGLAYQVMAATGSLTAGRLVDMTHEHKLVSIGLLAVAFLSLSVYCAVASHAASTSSVLTWFALAGTGYTLGAWNTVGMEFASVLTFPADEGAVAGILESSAELMGFVLVTLGGWCLEVSSATSLLLVLVSCVSLSAISLGMLKTEEKRPRS